jgi:tRNA 2-thiouridine synthesizing protein A
MRDNEPLTLNALGLKCPLPVLRAKQRLASMAIGEQLCVLADDPTAKRDFEGLAQHTSHLLLRTEPREDGGWVFWLQKGV